MRIPENHAPPDHHGPTALVVVNGDDVFEDLFTAASELHAVLTDEGFVTRTGLGMGRFDHAVDDDLIVLCTALGEFTAAQRRGLRNAVSAGAGLLAFHATNVPASPPGDPDEADRLLSELIGSRYVSHGPAPHESRFSVFPDPGHELTAGIAPFEVTHEHYALAVEDHAEVVARRGAPEGAHATEGTQGVRDAQPLVHVSEFGKGRVCYVQLGHDMRIWAEPAVRLLIRRAARWVNRLEVQGVAS
jgi:type 1 glutamine amidotransferase